MRDMPAVCAMRKGQAGLYLLLYLLDRSLLAAAVEICLLCRQHAGFLDQHPAWSVSV
jgi:hypothetical protein